MSETPDPRNAPGPFYVRDGCCITCAVPWTEAPDLFGGLRADGAAPDGCFVVRQPETSDELARMLRVLDLQDVMCIRYRGAALEIREHLRVSGLSELCDEPDEP